MGAGISWGLLIMRIALGVTFLPHGRMKLNPRGPMKGPGGFAAWLKQMGVPLSGVLGWLVVLLETVGAGLLILGLGTRLVALGLVNRHAGRDRIGETRHAEGCVHGCEGRLGV